MWRIARTKGSHRVSEKRGLHRILGTRGFDILPKPAMELVEELAPLGFGYLWIKGAFA